MRNRDDSSPKQASLSRAQGTLKPPAEHRFQPGKSGNPGGRPKGTNERRATVKRVLMEKHRADPAGTGKPQQYPPSSLC